MINRSVPVLPLDSDRARVELHERIIGPFGQLFHQDLAIALEPPLPERRISVPRVPDRNIGPPHRHIRPPQSRQGLLVNPIRPPHILTQRKLSAIVDLLSKVR